MLLALSHYCQHAATAVLVNWTFSCLIYTSAETGFRECINSAWNGLLEWWNEKFLKVDYQSLHPNKAQNSLFKHF